MFGKLKLEVLDASGKVVDTIHATNRRGVNRVVWSMRSKAPHVPKAAQVAGYSLQGPRVVPGTYTVRLTKGAGVIEQTLDVGVDRRAPYSVADRKADFEAATRAAALFDDMSELVGRIEALAAATEARRAKLTADDALSGKLADVGRRLEEARTEVVATKEGGAITGEERIREHLDEVYGAFIDWEGRPARYQVERVAALRRELDDVSRQVDAIVASGIRPLDAELRARHLEPVPQAAGPEAELDLSPPDKAMLRCLASRGAACELPDSQVAEDR